MFKTKTFNDPRPRPRLSFLSSRRLETKTLVSRTTSLTTTTETDIQRHRERKERMTSNGIGEHEADSLVANSNVDDVVTYR